MEPELRDARTARWRSLAAALNQDMKSRPFYSCVTRPPCGDQPCRARTITLAPCAGIIVTLR